jgi:glutamate racemase
VACNTASAIALPELAGGLSVPAVGVILPGVEAALRASRCRRVGVVGTEATIASGAYRHALRQKEPDLEVHERACPLFVPLAEEGWLRGEVPELAARHYLRDLIEAGIDTLILGCTHYPMLKAVIGQVAGAGITLVDSAEETARETQRTLAQRGLDRPPGTGGRCEIFVSDAARRFAEVGSAFLGEELTQITTVDQGDLPWYER